MMVIRKRLLGFGLALCSLVLVILSACGTPDPPAAIPPSPTPTPAASSPPTPLPADLPQVKAEALMAHVEALNHDRYFDRDRKKARAYITEQLTAAGWQVSEQVFETGVNLFAERPDADPEQGNLLVVAHYDSINGSPGADDNASGVAGVIEIGRLLGAKTWERNLQLVLFDQEEAGLIGSYAYTARPENLKNLEGVVNLEMLGYACYSEGCQRKAPGLPVEPPSKVGDFVAVVGDTEHLPLLQTFEATHTDTLPALMTVPIPLKGALTPIALLIDHTPFWYKDIGAVMVTDTAFLRNPHYHRRSDTPDSLDPKYFQGATQMALNATASLLANSTSLDTQQ